MGGACSAAQLRNATLTSQLYEVHRSLAGLAPRLPPSASAALRRAPALLSHAHPQGRCPLHYSRPPVCRPFLALSAQ